MDSEDSVGAHPATVSNADGSAETPSERGLVGREPEESADMVSNNDGPPDQPPPGGEAREGSDDYPKIPDVKQFDEIIPSPEDATEAAARYRMLRGSVPANEQHRKYWDRYEPTPDAPARQGVALEHRTPHSCTDTRILNTGWEVDIRTANSISTHKYYVSPEDKLLHRRDYDRAALESGLPAAGEVPDNVRQELLDQRLAAQEPTYQQEAAFGLNDKVVGTRELEYFTGIALESSPRGVAYEELQTKVVQAIDNMPSTEDAEELVVESPFRVSPEQAQVAALDFRGDVSISVQDDPNKTDEHIVTKKVTDTASKSELRVIIKDSPVTPSGTLVGQPKVDVEFEQPHPQGFIDYYQKEHGGITPEQQAGRFITVHNFDITNDELWVTRAEHAVDNKGNVFHRGDAEKARLDRAAAQDIRNFTRSPDIFTFRPAPLPPDSE
jgi:hypothetical protein